MLSRQLGRCATRGGVALIWVLPQSVWRRGSIRARRSSGPAIVHRALEGLQAIDLPLRLTVAQRELDGNAHGVNISVQRSGKAHDRRDIRLYGVIDLRVQRGGVFSAQNVPESHGHAPRRGKAWRSGLSIGTQSWV